MGKFKIKNPTPKMLSVSGGVSKYQPCKYKKKLENMLKINRLSTPKEKYLPSKNRFTGMVKVETAKYCDYKSFKNSLQKLKSVSVQTSMSSDPLYQDNTLHNYSQIFNDSDSSPDDGIHWHKSTQTSGKFDLEYIKIPELKPSTSTMRKQKSKVDVPFVVESYDSSMEETGGMTPHKRKRKQKRKFDAPLVVEAHMPMETSAPPRLLQSYDSETPDINAALREFYDSLKETSAEVHVTSDISVCVESDNDVETAECIDEGDKSSVSSKECEKPSILFHLVNKNQVLVFMKHPFSLFFKGMLNITVLRGCIEVLGFVMDSYSNAQWTVYSPKGSCMLGIDTCVADPPCSDDYELLGKVFEDLDIDFAVSNALIANIEHCSCVLLLETPTQSPFENYLKTLMAEMQLFSFSKSLEQGKSRSHLRSEGILNCVFEFANRKKYKQYMKTEEWEETLDAIIRSNKEDAGACTVVCGGKGVGKSTFLRFLVNRHLTLFREVLVLDFDPGQAEFTVPGCVSAVVVTQPLLGPNFTHLHKPSCMVYVGNVDIAQCPKHYLDSAEHIINFCRGRTDFQKMPCIVNTMGFNKGIGVDLTVNLLRLLNPRFVVQIMSRNYKLNFPAHLSAGYVWQYRSSFSHIPTSFIPYSLFNIVSASEEAEEKKGLHYRFDLKAVHLREAMVISYFSKLLVPPTYSMTEIVPYKITLSKLILSVCHTSVPNSQILSAMNGNLVALCIYKGNDIFIPDDEALPCLLRNRAACPCLGFGVVRGVDLEEKILYLVTPLSERDLSHVNCLMLGAVMLPDYVYTQFEAGKGHVPYVATGPGQATSKPKTRPYFVLQDNAA